MHIDTTSAANPNAQSDADAADSQVNQAMKVLYDHYFASQDYGKRYPYPNQATLEFVLRQGAARAHTILDFGCGNGRYALALLQTTHAKLTGYDISETALAEFRVRLEQTQDQARVRLLHGELAVLHHTGSYDMVLMLFGVLSHVGGAQARIRTLTNIRNEMSADAKLLLTVPNLWRRRPFEIAKAAWLRWTGQATGLQTEPGSIVFSRKLAGVDHQFFYHLFTVRALKLELLQAGFEVLHAEAESVLPEWLITQHAWLGQWDAKLSACLPAYLGYGIRAVARPL